MVPGVMWWAMDPESAAAQGPQLGPKTTVPKGESVVLLDEIDKADPDMPNDLLVPSGSGPLRGHRDGSENTVQEQAYLLLITTNGERELAPAFVRRPMRRCSDCQAPRETGYSRSRTFISPKQTREGSSGSPTRL